MRAHVVTNLTGTAQGRILTGARDGRAQHLRSSQTPCIPCRSSGSNEGGKLSFDMPAKSVAVVTVN